MRQVTSLPKRTYPSRAARLNRIKQGRLGVPVDKMTHMVESYAPKDVPHSYLTPAEDAPSGMLGRGTYSVNSLFTDNDKSVKEPVMLPEPEYESAATELDGWGITLAEVGGTRQEELADQYNVGGWPVLKMFKKRKVFEYNRPMEMQNIVDFVKEQLEPPDEEENHVLGITNNVDRHEAASQDHIPI